MQATRVAALAAVLSSMASNLAARDNNNFGVVRPLAVTKYAATIWDNTPCKIQQSELISILDVALPSDAKAALAKAEDLLKIATDKTAGYKWHQLPKLRITAINKTLQLLNDTQAMLKTSRVKRGWFDIVGNFLKLTTGVATEKDVALLKDTFLSGRESLAINLKKIVLHNNVLTQSIQKLNAAANVQKDLLLQEINRDRLWHHISTAISLAADLTHFSATLSMQYKWLIDQLRLNMIPKSILNSSIFENLLENNFDKTKDFFDPNFLTIEPTKQLSKFFLKMPIFTNQTFLIHEVVPLPLDRKANESFLIIENYKRYVGLSISNSSYFLSKNKPDCVSPSSKRIFALCKIDVELYDYKVQSCEKDIILQKNKPKCNFKKYGGNKKFFIKKAEESFIIKFFQNTKVTVTCGNKKYFRDIKGVVMLNPPCLLESELIKVITNNKLYTKGQIQISDWSTSHFFDSHTDFEEIIFSNYNTPLNKIKILNETLEDTLKMNLTELKYDNLRLKNISEVHFTINYSILSVIIITITGVTIYLAVKRWNKRSKPKDKDVLCCLHPREDKNIKHEE